MTDSHLFQPGQSGNPAGRPPGRGRTAALRRAIEARSTELVNALFDAALAGDVAAGKALLDRVVPSLRPVDEAVTLTLGGWPIRERTARPGGCRGGADHSRSSREAVDRHRHLGPCGGG